MNQLDPVVGMKKAAARRQRLLEILRSESELLAAAEQSTDADKRTTEESHGARFRNVAGRGGVVVLHREGAGGLLDGTAVQRGGGGNREGIARDTRGGGSSGDGAAGVDGGGRRTSPGAVTGDGSKRTASAVGGDTERNVEVRRAGEGARGQLTGDVELVAEGGASERGADGNQTAQRAERGAGNVGDGSGERGGVVNAGAIGDDRGSIAARGHCHESDCHEDKFFHSNVSLLRDRTRASIDFSKALVLSSIGKFRSPRQGRSRRQTH